LTPTAKTFYAKKREKDTSTGRAGISTTSNQIARRKEFDANTRLKDFKAKKR